MYIQEQLPVGPDQRRYAELSSRAIGVDYLTVNAIPHGCEGGHGPHGTLA